jgi:hypothetical protein
MAGKLAGLRRRLEKAEKALAETVEQEKMANCICKKSRPMIVRSDQPEELEVEMNQKCPVHGFRHLGTPLIVIRCSDTDLPDERFRIDDLLDEYKARKSAFERAKLEHVNQKG